MDRDSLVQITDSPSELLPPIAADSDEQGERLRRELLAAAEEEAAAIVENARSEITTVVRRARRDLLLIRAQLQLCGVEPTDIPVSVSPGPWIDDTPVGHPPVSPVARRLLTASTLIAAGVLVLFIAGGVIGWSSSNRENPPVAGTGASAPGVPADSMPAPLPVGETIAPATPEHTHVSAVASAEPAPASPVAPPPARSTPVMIPQAVTAIASLQPSTPLPAAPGSPAPAQPVAGAPAPALQLQPSPAANVAGQEPHADILARHAEWLDAYARGDRGALGNLTTDGFSLRDERTARDGTPMQVAITPAQLSDVHVDVAGVGAVLSARVRASVDGVVSESLLSEVWVRGDQQQWTLMGVRITPVDRNRSER